MARAEIIIAGAGIIGLALALQLRLQGRTVHLLDSAAPGQASTAAAGMLAAHDPAHPPELRPLAEFSAALYPGFLDTLYRLSGERVPFETEYVLENDASTPGHPTSLPALSPDIGPLTLRPERSLDPRKLLPALRSAALAAGVHLQPGSTLAVKPAQGASISIATTAGPLEAETFLDCTGAFAGPLVRPVKGQMLRIQLPPGLLRHSELGNVVLRTPEIYIVPRLDGTALIGATLEDDGFTTDTRTADLQCLRDLAAHLVPALANAPEIESWAGLRPRTADGLPILGQRAPRHYIAGGHYRNGILLAPATARVMAQLLHGAPTDVSIHAFAPQRFGTDIQRSSSPITAHV